MTEHLKTEIAAGVMTLTLARPDKKNALSNAMYSAMSDGLERAEKDRSVRVVLFQGDGDSFTAGNDIGDFMQAADEGGALSAPALRFLYALVRSEKPLVAAVTGVAVGVGTTMLLHCDHVVAAADARFSTPFAALGLTPEAASFSVDGQNLLMLFNPPSAGDPGDYGRIAACWGPGKAAWSR